LQNTDAIAFEKAAAEVALATVPSHLRQFLIIGDIMQSRATFVNKPFNFIIKFAIS